MTIGDKSGRGEALALTLFIVGYPLWWSLGAGILLLPALTVIALWFLASRRRVEFPPLFGIWLVFLAMVVFSIFNLGATPPGTVESSWMDQAPGAAFRLGFYLSVSVIALWAYNLIAYGKLSVERLIVLLAYWGIVTVVGGLLGTFAGGIEFTSPVEAALPASVAQDGFVQSLVHPSLSQTMNILGYESHRPAAPWGYTNTWGNMCAMTVAWLTVVAMTRGTKSGGPTPTWSRLRPWAWVALALAMIPIVYSLNRGLWLGLAVMALVVAVKLLWAGRVVAILSIMAIGVLAGAVVLLSPMRTVISDRIDNPHSDEGRSFASETAVDLTVEHSPLIGFGSTRKTLGSGDSIAIGPTADCPRCGARTLGGNGQLWQLIFAHGFLGLAAYLGFILAVLWRFRHDHSPVGIAGAAVMVFSVVSMLFYNALVMPLFALLLSYVVLAARERLVAETRTRSDATPQQRPPPRPTRTSLQHHRPEFRDIGEKNE
ncbi:O-antigen ligase family protein [Haloglycomyces albus]|uniref:O-antigen ligase family protein n=1 Tax=Haloglycomyces albus TaxID=526067 RepID=UPI00046D36C4|nr:hypothetical protein [Haloglycomyces albus]